MSANSFESESQSQESQMLAPSISVGVIVADSAGGEVIDAGSVDFGFFE